MRLPFKGLDRAAYLRLAGAGAWLAVSLWLASLAYFSIYYGWGHDMMHFWGGARTFLDGGDPYVVISSYPGIYLTPAEQFHPLPWVGLLFCPLAAIPLQAAIRVWAALNCLLVLASVILVWDLHKALAPWGTALIAMVVVLMQVRTLQSAQLGILVTAAILLALACLRRGKSFVAGILLSLSIFKPWISVGILGSAVLVAFRRRNHSLLVGLLVGVVVIVLGTTLLWPTWLASYPQVDFSQALGHKSGDEFLELWPVANLFDFTKYVLLWPQTPSLRVLQIVVLVLATGWLVFDLLRKWRAGRVDDLFLVGVGALIPLLVFPYVRYYDYAILACWWILVAPTLLSMPTLPVWQKWFSLSLMLLGLSFLFGSHLEPWVYQLVVCLYVATVAGLAFSGRVRGKDLPTEAAEASTGVGPTRAGA